MYKNSNFDSSLGSSVPAFSMSRNFSVDIRYGTVFPKLITSMDFENYMGFFMGKQKNTNIRTNILNCHKKTFVLFEMLDFIL